MDGAFDVETIKMSRGIVRRHVAPEMLALSVVEMVLTFALALILLTPSPLYPSIPSVHFALICALTVCFIAFVTGLYRPQMFERAKSLMFSTLLSALLSFPAVWLVTKGLGVSGYWPVGYDSYRPIKVVVIWCLAVSGVRLVFFCAARLNLFVHRVALVGMNDTPSVLAAVSAGRRGFLEISVVKSGEFTASDLRSRGIRTVVIPGSGGQNLLDIAALQECSVCGIAVELEAGFWERHLRRVNILNLADTISAYPSNQTLNKASSVVIRAFDLVVSSAFLLATLPIIGIVSILIKMESSGPILYYQERVGINGIPFVVLKFRSMKVDAEASGPRWASQGDPRVTRIGAFLRRTRIDELPQLLNILRGEMSFIGPRPERPHFVEQLSSVIPFYQERSRVKPGLTGWAQVNYPYGASVEDARAKLSFDLYYVKNRTVLLDILILFATIRVILLQEGAR